MSEPKTDLKTDGKEYFLNADLLAPLSYPTLCLMFADMVVASGEESTTILRETLVTEIGRLSELLSLQAEAEAAENALMLNGSLDEHLN